MLDPKLQALLSRFATRTTRTEKGAPMQLRNGKLVGATLRQNIEEKGKVDTGHASKSEMGPDDERTSVMSVEGRAHQSPGKLFPAHTISHSIQSAMSDHGIGSEAGRRGPHSAGSHGTHENGDTMRAFIQSVEIEHEDAGIPRERWGHEYADT